MSIDLKEEFDKAYKCLNSMPKGLISKKYLIELDEVSKRFKKNGNFIKTIYYVQDIKFRAMQELAINLTKQMIALNKGSKKDGNE